MHRRAVPDHAVRGARLRRRARRAQPVERRGDRLAGRASTTSSSASTGQPAWNEADEARAIGATCGGVRVWSLYVPNGRTVEDPHYTYKLEWLAALTNTASGWLADDPAAPIALVGDWNIAPTDDDVWDVEVFKGSTHVTEPERAAFRAIEGRVRRRGPAVRAAAGQLHLLGLHPAEVPQAPGHAHRLHPRLTGSGGPRHARRDRPRRTQARQEGHPGAKRHAPVLVDLS